MNISSLKKIYTHSPLSLIKLNQGLNYWPIFHFYRKAQWWSRDKIEVWQLERLKRVVSFAYNHTVGYRQLYEEYGVKPTDIHTLKDIAFLPFVDKQLLRSNIAAFTAKQDYNGWDKIHKFNKMQTGGSSGEPFTFYLDNMAFEGAFMTNAWRLTGWHPSDKGIALRGAYVGDKDHLLSHTGYHHWSLSPNYLTDETYEKYIEEILKTKATYIHCYPSTIVELSKFIIRHHDSGRLRIKQLFISSEGLHDPEKEIIRQAFPEAKMMHWYGHAERAIWAPWCETDERFHVCPFYGIAEVINESREVGEGEVGELVGTSLWNFATPFIRYRTNDYAEKGVKGCNHCGRQFQLLNRIEGRLQEYLIGSTGRKIAFSVFDGSFMHSDAFMKVNKYRFIQYEPGKLILAIIPFEGFSDSDEKALTTIINNYLGEDFECVITHVDQLSKTKSGKFTLVEQHLYI